jgi:hypothetical protein
MSQRILTEAACLALLFHVLHLVASFFLFFSNRFHEAAPLVKASYFRLDAKATRIVAAHQRFSTHIPAAIKCLLRVVCKEH